MTGIPTRHPRLNLSPWAYAWWAITGAVLAGGVVGLLTVGVVFLALGGVLAIVGLTLPPLRTRAAVAAVAGAGAAPGYIAWLNRGGPGRVCHLTTAGTECTDAWSPWPFVGVAILLIALCIVLVRRMPHDQA